MSASEGSARGTAALLLLRYQFDITDKYKSARGGRRLFSIVDPRCCFYIPKFLGDTSDRRGAGFHLLCEIKSAPALGISMHGYAFGCLLLFLSDDEGGRLLVALLLKRMMQMSIHPSDGVRPDSKERMNAAALSLQKLTVKVLFFL